MSLIQCRECGNKISSKAKMCPKCGYRYEEEEVVEKKKSNSSQNIFIAAFVVAIFILLIYFLGKQINPFLTSSFQVNIEATITGKQSAYRGSYYYNKISWQGDIRPYGKMTCENASVTLLLKANYKDYSSPYDTRFYQKRIRVLLDSNCRANVHEIDRLQDWAKNTTVNYEIEVEKVRGNMKRYF